MGLIVLRHGQDGDHGDASLFPVLAAGSLVDGGEIRVHVSRIAAASRHFLAGCRHLAERVRIIGDIRQDDEHMHLFLKSKILCRGQRHPGRSDTLDGRVIGQVDEQHGAVKGSCLPETLDKEVGLFKGDSHCREYNGKVLIRPQHLRLSRDLRGKLGVGQARCGEDRQLLSPDQCVQPVNGGHAGLDKLLGIAPGSRVHGQAVDIHARVRQDLRSLVDRAAQTIEHTAQHIFRYAQLHAPPEKTHPAVGKVDPGRALKKLYEHIAPVDFQHFAAPCLPVRELDLAQLVICHAFHAAHQHQRSGYFLYGPVLFGHLPFLLSECIGDLHA